MIIELDKVSEEIRNNTDAILKDIAVKLSNELRKEAPVNRGQLRQSFKILEESEDKIYVGSRLKYAPVIQHGSKPFVPPIKPLKLWARRKLGEEGLAYKVRHKISKKGINKNPYVTRAVENVRQKFG